MEFKSPGFPSYYEDINMAMPIIKYLSLGILIILIILMIIRKIQKKSINKWLVISSIILFIITLLASFIKMPYWT